MDMALKLAARHMLAPNDEDPSVDEQSDVSYDGSLYRDNTASPGRSARGAGTPTPSGREERLGSQDKLRALSRMGVKLRRRGPASRRLKPGKERKQSEKERLAALRAQLRLEDVIKPKETAYRRVTRDDMIRVVKSLPPGSLTPRSRERLERLGVDRELFDAEGGEIGNVAAVSVVTVGDVRVTDIDRPPLAVPMVGYMRAVAAAVDAAHGAGEVLPAAPSPRRSIRSTNAASTYGSMTYASLAQLDTSGVSAAVSPRTAAGVEDDAASQLPARSPRPGGGDTSPRGSGGSTRPAQRPPPAGDPPPGSFAAMFLTDGNTSLALTVFWFVFAAFFQKQDLPFFADHLERLAAAQFSSFWRSLRHRSQTLHERFYDVFPVAVAHAVCLAHIKTFPGSKNLFKTSWADRVYVLVLKLLSGLENTEATCSGLRQKYFTPNKALKRHPDPARAASVRAIFEEVALDLLPSEYSVKELSIKSSGEQPLRRQAQEQAQKRLKHREVVLSHESPAKAYEYGVYLPQGSSIDGKRAVDMQITMLQKNCLFNIAKERFRFGRFPVDVKLHRSEPEFNVFNTAIFDYDYALTLCKGAQYKPLPGTTPPETERGMEAESTTFYQTLKASKMITGQQTHVGAQAGCQMVPGHYLPAEPQTLASLKKVEDLPVDHLYIAKSTPRYDPFAFELCAHSFRQAVAMADGLECTHDMAIYLRSREHDGHPLSPAGEAALRPRRADPVTAMAAALLALCAVAAHRGACRRLLTVVGTAFTDDERRDLAEMLLQRRGESGTPRNGLRFFGSAVAALYQETTGRPVTAPANPAPPLPLSGIPRPSHTSECAARDDADGGGADAIPPADVLADSVFCEPGNLLDTDLFSIYSGDYDAATQAAAPPPRPYRRTGSGGSASGGPFLTSFDAIARPPPPESESLSALRADVRATLRSALADVVVGVAEGGGDGAAGDASPGTSDAGDLDYNTITKLASPTLSGVKKAIRTTGPVIVVNSEADSDAVDLRGGGYYVSHPRRVDSGPLPKRAAAAHDGGVGCTTLGEVMGGLSTVFGPKQQNKNAAAHSQRQPRMGLGAAGLGADLAASKKHLRRRKSGGGGGGCFIKEKPAPNKGRPQEKLLALSGAVQRQVQVVDAFLGARAASAVPQAAEAKAAKSMSSGGGTRSVREASPACGPAHAAAGPGDGAGSPPASPKRVRSFGVASPKALPQTAAKPWDACDSPKAAFAPRGSILLTRRDSVHDRMMPWSRDAAAARAEEAAVKKQQQQQRALHPTHSMASTYPPKPRPLSRQHDPTPIPAAATAKGGIIKAEGAGQVRYVKGVRQPVRGLGARALPQQLEHGQGGGRRGDSSCGKAASHKTRDRTSPKLTAAALAPAGTPHAGAAAAAAGVLRLRVAAHRDSKAGGGGSAVDVDSTPAPPLPQVMSDGLLMLPKANIDAFAARPATQESVMFTACHTKSTASENVSSAAGVGGDGPAASPPYCPAPTGQRYRDKYKRGAYGAVMGTTYLHEVSPMVEATLGMPREMRVAQNWVSRTLTSGREVTDQMALAKRIAEAHEVAKAREKESTEAQSRQYTLRRTELEQDIQRLTVQQRAAHEDRHRRSEFCDNLTALPVKRSCVELSEESYKGSRIADAAQHVAVSLDKDLRKLDTKLRGLNSKIKAQG